jgi:GAF domain-containing protein
MDAMSPEASTIGGDQSLEELKGELAEAREQQAATSEILRVISSSPMDSERVFAEIAASAARLCDASDAAIHRVDGEALRLVVSHGSIPKGDDTLPLTREVVTGRAVLDGRTIQVADVQVETGEYPVGSVNARRLGHRTLLAIPLMRAGEAIGVIGIRRTEVRPFTDRQIDLLKTFADQAVIAIENTRLLNELRESLQQQTATADVLKIISRSTFDLQPILEALIKNATKLCRAEQGFIFRSDGELYHLAADYNAPARFREWTHRRGIPPGDGTVVGRVALEGRTLQILDAQADTAWRTTNAQAPGTSGVRTLLGVPMRREGVLIGVIAMWRTEIRPFTDKQLALVETFADQAVIAIENTRLLNELRESLQQQTATADVLKVISRSTFDLQAVLNTLVEAAAQLCEADMAQILRPRDTVYYNAASYGFSPEYMESHKTLTFAPGRGSLTGRVLLEGKPIQIPDVLADPEYSNLEPQRLGGYRTHLGVPLLRDGSPIGVILVSRRTVRPFDSKQIELVTTFADQAVIAIENTRLFEDVQSRTKELQESLEYQTATSEVLGVIGRSPSDVQPVLDAIVQTAVRLCDAEYAIVYKLDDGRYHPVATNNVEDQLVKYAYAHSLAPGRGSLVGRTALERRTVHLPDCLADPEYDHLEYQRIGKYRSTLGVPLLRQGVAIGVIVLMRAVVKPFTDKQIELVTTFADQAVIAIENTRLFEAEQARTRELSVALQRQTATSEILGIISASPGKLEPVFDAILERARELCSAKFGHLLLLDGQAWRAAALHNVPPAYAEFWRGAPPAALRVTLLSRLLETKRPYQLEDLRLSEAYRMRVPLTVATVELAGARTLLGVPLLKDDQAIGAIVLYRTEVRPFDERQIGLLSSFADQAVIAIENTRLFEEVQARTRELTESLQQQTGTAEVLKVISRSAFDLQSVLQALVESAARLCDADKGTITRQIDGVFYRAESYGYPAEVMERWKALPVTPERGSAAGRALLEGRTVHVPDADADPDYTFDMAGVRMRSMLGVPMLREGVPIGVLALARSDVRPFTDKQIDLVSTFADQAAIAIENVRLFEEVQARTWELAKTVEDLEIASQHKSQFVANMSHELRTPLAAILGYAELMQEGFYEPLGQKSLDALTRIRSNGKHLLGLINTVLDIAKIESGQFTLNMTDYAIESVVETVRAATESLAQNKKLTLTTSVDRSLPVGLGDEQRLTQVLLNLVGNAIKFTDTGEVCVSAKAVNGHFNVSVTDTGPGIPVEHQARIFDQFHQVDSSNTKAKGGTGLGLAIAKQIVEMHGGRIWVESTLGKGSTFQMELPTRAAPR